MSRATKTTEVAMRPRKKFGAAKPVVLIPAGWAEDGYENLADVLLEESVIIVVDHPGVIDGQHRHAAIESLIATVKKGVS